MGATESKPGLRIGVITSAHGIRGQVKIHCFSEDPADLLRYGALYDASGGRRFALTRQGVKGRQLIVAIEGITDRNEAERLKGTELYAHAAPQENTASQFRYAELLGLEARTPEGAVYGRVVNIDNFGAGDILELERTGGQLEMLPFTAAFIGEVAPPQGYLIVHPPEYTTPGDPDDTNNNTP